MKKQVTVEMWSFKPPQFLNKLFVFILLSIASFNASAQVGTVTGKVLDDKGEPIIGATIEVIDAFKKNIGGTVTDMEGNYSIEVKDIKLSSLKISFLGNKTQTIQVKGQTTIDAKLAEDSEVLDEVVAIGYGAKKESQVTEAIEHISEKDMKLTSNTSLENAIQGRAAGVQVTQISGRPGSTSSVRIRGVGSINGGEPLYVIDGLPVNSDAINLLNPNDIQSMDILKDASATAIYGSRGSNGVVMITTKRGKEGANKVSFESNYGISDPWKKLKMLDNAQFLSYVQDSYKNSGQGVPNAFNPNSATPNPYINNNTDWQKQIFNRGTQQNYNLNLSGGSEKATYSVSGGYTDQKGILINTNFQRYSLRVNTDLNVKKWLKVGQSLGVSRTNERTEYGNTINHALAMTPLLPVNDASTESGYSIVTPQTVGGFNWANITALNNLNNANNLRYRAIGNVYAEISVLKNFKYRINMGLDYLAGKNKTISEKFIGGGITNFDNQKRTVSDSRDYRLNWLVDHTISYNKIFKEAHDISLLVGVSTQEFYTSDLGVQSSGLPKDINVPGFGDATKTVTGGTDGINALRGYLGRFMYSYKSKYLLTVNSRYDGSSKFSKENRYGFFPSFSVGYRLIEEDFMKKMALFKLYVSDLKIRGGWGKTGNQEVLDPNRILVLMNNEIRYPFGGNNGPSDGNVYAGAAPRGLANSQLRWEQVITTNVGIDLGLLKNKIYLSADYFIKESSGMLVRVPLPNLAGLAWQGDYSIWANAGNMQNKGIELSLSYRNEDHKFKYSVSGNISRIRNKVTKLGVDDVPIFGNNTITQVGSPVGSYYGWEMVGIFQDQADINSSAAQRVNSLGAGLRDSTKIGDVKFLDTDGNGIINDKDRKVLGNSIPKLTYGLSATAQYMGFDLRVFFQGVYGNSIYNGQRSNLESLGSGSPPDGNQLESVKNRWSPNNASNEMPRATKQDINLNGRASSRWVEDGSFVRIKSVQLGYTIPSKLFERVAKDGEVNFRIYLSGSNLLTFTKYKGMDPEVGSTDPINTGIDNGNYPQARTFIGGLQIGF